MSTKLEVIFTETNGMIAMSTISDIQKPATEAEIKCLVQTRTVFELLWRKFSKENPDTYTASGEDADTLRAMVEAGLIKFKPKGEGNADKG